MKRWYLNLMLNHDSKIRYSEILTFFLKNHYKENTMVSFVIYIISFSAMCNSSSIPLILLCANIVKFQTSFHLLIYYFQLRNFAYKFIYILSLNSNILWSYFLLKNTAQETIEKYNWVKMIKFFKDKLL